MRAPLWPTELSRRSTPPGTRTRNRSLRRRPRFPLCASGVRLSKESNPAQCRPGDSNPASFRGKSPVPVLSGASGKVGHLGVEPSATALSGRPLRPAGSWPAEDGGVEPRGTVTATGFQGPLPRRRHIFHSCEESGGLEPQRCYAHPHSKRRPQPWRVHSPQRISRCR